MRDQCVKRPHMQRPFSCKFLSCTGLTKPVPRAGLLCNGPLKGTCTRRNRCNGPAKCLCAPRYICYQAHWSDRCTPLHLLRTCKVPFCAPLHPLPRALVRPVQSVTSVTDRQSRLCGLVKLVTDRQSSLDHLVTAWNAAMRAISARCAPPDLTKTQISCRAAP